MMQTSKLSLQEWNRRHGLLCGLLTTAVVALVPISGAEHGVRLDFAYAAGIALLLAAALTSQMPRVARELSVALGLVMTAGAVVHVSGGAVEAQFLFFVLIPLLVLYERAWLFCPALGFVFAQSGMGLHGLALSAASGGALLALRIRAADQPRPGFAAISEEDLLVEDLRRGIAAGELVLHYQPKIDLARGTCRGAEALVRWQHPERGLVFPDDFIPLAERSGLTQALTEQVLDDALTQCAAWRRAGRQLSVAVNVDPETLAAPEFPQRVAELVRLHGISPFLLELEITETAVTQRPDDVRDAVAYLKRFGVGTSVDDFGTGFSSMAQLATLAVKTLKVDRSFVMDMSPGGKNEAIVRSTITLAKRLRLRTVAEGVEDEATARRLFEMGCEVGQGYLWSRPLAPAAFDDWLAGYEAVPFSAGGPALAVDSGHRLRRRAVEASESVEVLRASLTVGNACAQATSRDQIVTALRQMVLSLGGSVVGEDDVLGPDVIDIDLSLGTGVGLYATAASDSLQRHSIEQALHLSIPGATATAARLQLPVSA